MVMCEYWALNLRAVEPRDTSGVALRGGKLCRDAPIGAGLLRLVQRAIFSGDVTLLAQKRADLRCGVRQDLVAHLVAGCVASCRKAELLLGCSGRRLGSECSVFGQQIRDRLGMRRPLGKTARVASRTRASDAGREGSSAVMRADDIVERNIPKVLWGVAVFEAAMAIRNVVVLPTPASVIIPIVQMILVAIAVVFALRLAKHPSTQDQTTWLIAGAAMAVGLSIPLEQALTGHGLLAANLGLMIVASGSLLVSTRAFVVTVLVLLAGWVLAVGTRTAWDVPFRDQAVLLVGALFAAVVLHAVRVSDRRSLVAALDRAVDVALRDELTGLWNRRGGRAAARTVIGMARADGQDMWCLFLDVRGLKQVNDTLGHDAGDRLLAGIGHSLQDFADDGVVVMRWGGDEFGLLGAGTPPESGELICAVEQSVGTSWGPLDHPWSLSPGWCRTGELDDSDVFDILVHGADQDMYRRRAQGDTAESGPPDN